VDVEAEIRRLEGTSDDLAESDDSNQLSSIATPDQIRDDRALPATMKILAPALVGLRDVHPRTMKTPAGPGQRQKLG
jgi:hypothetical protein